MSYESVREHIHRCRAQANDHLPKDTEFLDALDELTVAIEADLVQIKAALSHVALLLEDREDV